MRRTAQDGRDRGNQRNRLPAIAPAAAYAQRRDPLVPKSGCQRASLHSDVEESDRDEDPCEKEHYNQASRGDDNDRDLLR